MRTSLRLCLLLACGGFSPMIAHAGWEAVEKTETYAIAGKSGPELYASIGEHGPKIGVARTIAHTNFKLTWTRKYENEGDACVLSSALPKLIITYTLPKPSGQLPAAIARNWQTFIAGMTRHERVHGDHIKEMVRDIEAATVGLTVPGDPNCRKIRTEMTRRLSELSQTQRRRGRDFDRLEMSKGGNIHQLILNLVNGG